MNMGEISKGLGEERSHQVTEKSDFRKYYFTINNLLSEGISNEGAQVDLSGCFLFHRSHMQDYLVVYHLPIASSKS